MVNINRSFVVKRSSLPLVMEVELGSNPLEYHFTGYASSSYSGNESMLRYTLSLDLAKHRLKLLGSDSNGLLDLSYWVLPKQVVGSMICRISGVIDRNGGFSWCVSYWDIASNNYITLISSIGSTGSRVVNSVVGGRWGIGVVDDIRSEALDSKIIWFIAVFTSRKSYSVRSLSVQGSALVSVFDDVALQSDELVAVGITKDARIQLRIYNRVGERSYTALLDHSGIPILNSQALPNWVIKDAVVR